MLAELRSVGPPIRQLLSTTRVRPRYAVDEDRLGGCRVLVGVPREDSPDRLPRVFGRIMQGGVLRHDGFRGRALLASFHLSVFEKKGADMVYCVPRRQRVSCCGCLTVFLITFFSFKVK